MVTTLTIRHMHAIHAVRAVYTALSGLDGIARADVALGRAVVEHDERVTRAALEAAVEAAGFEVENVVEERRSLPLL